MQCECGCGRQTKPARSGGYNRFVHGHNHIRFAEEHPAWAGDQVKYRAAHAWLTRHYKKEVCEKCGSTKNLDWAFRGLNGEWSRNREDYTVECRSCHKSNDEARRLVGSTV